MDYAKHYNKLIESRLSREIEGYFETHHIVPRCLGGSDDTSNLIKLTAREHLIAHILLMKINPEIFGLTFAVTQMSKKGILNGRSYEYVRKTCSKNQSLYFKDLWNDPLYRDKQEFRNSEDYKTKMSVRMKEYYQTEEGLKNIEIVRKKITGKVISEEHRNKISEATKGISKPEGFGDKISKARTGMKFTEEHIENFKKSRVGKGMGDRNSMSTEENRRKVSESKIGTKAVYSIDGSRQMKRKEELHNYYFRNGKYYNYE